MRYFEVQSDVRECLANHLNYFADGMDRAGKSDRADYLRHFVYHDENGISRVYASFSQRDLDSCLDEVSDLICRNCDFNAFPNVFTAIRFFDGLKDFEIDEPDAFGFCWFRLKIHDYSSEKFLSQLLYN